MYIFIVNPKAGHGRAKRVFTKITKSDLYRINFINRSLIKKYEHKLY